MDNDDEFDKAFENFGEDKKPEETKPEPKTEEKEEVKQPEKKVEEPEKSEEKTEDTKKPEEEPKKETEKTDPEEEKKTEEGDEKVEEPTGTAPTPETTPKTKEEPEQEVKPLTEDAMRNLLQDIRTEERNSTKQLETSTKEVLDAYYPEGLSNTLVDQNTGKELKSPQDVVDASGGSMSIEEANQWLMNEQYKLDQEIKRIKDDAQNIAETTMKFRQDGETVLKRYKPLFEAYPKLQGKVWNQYKKLVKADEEKGVVLSAPDMQEFYDTMLEPYRLAYEQSQQQPATAPTTETKPEAPKPTVEDRLDDAGDGGTTKPNDPNDFGQQVEKELAKGI